ncbi:MAG: ferrochelatase [Candidatus Eremiobacteraeota bacterium]|nr:ferrochelatase [Candidatus Eremiobacteraeota bacterium]
MSDAFDAIVLLGFGGPCSPEEVRPFLDRILVGRPVPPARYEAVVNNYREIGGSSPYNARTESQAVALRNALHARGIATPVLISYRNTAPFNRDTIDELITAGAKRVLGVPLTVFSGEESNERYIRDFDHALAEAGPDAPTVAYLEPFFEDPAFVRAHAESIREALALLGFESFDDVRVIFTAHSIPTATPGTYAADFELSSRLVAEELGLPDWGTAYQSRSGSPQTPWFGPDVRDEVRALPEAGVNAALLVAIGFLCDHVEVLYDLDIDAGGIGYEVGVRTIRAETMNDRPAFIAMLADHIAKALR